MTQELNFRRRRGDGGEGRTSGAIPGMTHLEICE